MMKAVSTSETSVNFYQTTRRNNPEESHLGMIFTPYRLVWSPEKTWLLLVAIVKNWISSLAASGYYLNMVWAQKQFQGILLLQCKITENKIYSLNWCWGFWVVTPGSLVLDVYQRSGRMYRLHFQGRSVHVYMLSEPWSCISYCPISLCFC
jgi:hypothetical protein